MASSPLGCPLRRWLPPACHIDVFKSVKHAAVTQMHKSLLFPSRPNTSQWYHTQPHARAVILVHTGGTWYRLLCTGGLEKLSVDYGSDDRKFGFWTDISATFSPGVQALLQSHCQLPSYWAAILLGWLAHLHGWSRLLQRIGRKPALAPLAVLHLSMAST